MNKPINMMLGIAMSILLFSCNSDDPDIIEEDPAPDFSITSTDNFEIVSKHPNGWIKEAISTISGNKYYEVVYHENGYLASYKVYYLVMPFSGLRFEHQRSENNLPISTKYYDTNGDIHAELVYENGDLVTKKIYEESYVSQYTYEDNKIMSGIREYNSGNQTTEINYDYNLSERSIIVNTADGITYERIVPLEDALGSSFDYIDDLELLNIVDGNYEMSERNIFTTSASSLDRESFFEASDVGNVSIYYHSLGHEETEQFGYDIDFHTMKGALNGQLFRGLAEQYPFSEGMTFVGYFKSVDKEYTGVYPSDVNIKVEEYQNLYGDDFGLLYGNNYVQSYVTGKVACFIGTLRNLPSDLSLRQQLIEIAYNHAEWITTGTDPISEEEEDLLDQIFFEFKVHAGVENYYDGVVLTNHDEYLRYTEEISQAENRIIQYKLVEY